MTTSSASDFKYYLDYSKWNNEENRTEDWQDSVERIMDMHRIKYSSIMSNELDQLIQEAEQAYKDKKFLASQRSLQFGGEPILKHEMKMYNCLSGVANRVDFFQEAMYLLLCGCGVGFSVQKQHIDCLPELQDRTKRTKTYVVEDSIEGWADAFGVLLSSFVNTDATFPEYQKCIVHFDLSKIRPKGSYISGGFKAPGPDGLRESLIKSEQVLQRRLDSGDTKIHPIDAYDFMMHMSDAVLSGGVRRSATICIFSKDDKEMLNAKTGDWFQTNPQRARSNNSVALLKTDTTKEEFDKIKASVREFGEPGFLWLDDLDICYNPCVEIGMYPWTEDGQSGWQGCVDYDTKLITRTGIETIGKVVDEDRQVEVWNGQKWSKVKPIQTGENRNLYRVSLSDGSYLDCTENHKWLVKDRFKEEFESVETKDLWKYSKYQIQTPRTNIVCDDNVLNCEPKAYDYGFILGDGTCYKRKDGSLRNPQAFVHEKYFELNFPFTSGTVSKPYSHPTKDETYFTITFNVDKEFSRRLKYSEGLPEEIFSWTRRSVIDFFAGWIDTDGTVTSKGSARVYGDECKIRDGQLLLSKIGIYSSVNLAAKQGSKTNKGVRNKDLWYLQITDTQDLYCTKGELKSKPLRGKCKYQIIKDIRLLPGSHNSYCFEEPELHQGVFNNVLTNQCNLCEINGSKIKSEQDFLDACKHAAVIGTLQAGYTDFKYVSDTTKQIFDREALLGVSVTGWTNSPEILFNPEIQRAGAEEVKKWNKVVADLIGINQAARTTCCKPSGNASVLLGCASGIHGDHAPRYFRNMQVNKESEIGKLFQEINPEACEESVWSSNNTDIIISFPIVSPKGSLFKEDLVGIDQLELVKLTQQNWVECGTNEELCVNPLTRHNVSNTIQVNDWDEVFDYIFENRQYFAGISLLSASGDKDYNQAPFLEVLDAKQLLEKYGDASILGSGLVVDGLSAFNENLWLACDTAMGFGEDINHESHSTVLKRDWVRRLKQFAERYLEGDLKLATYCLKDVYNFHRWLTINREAVTINWSEHNLKPDYVDADTLGSSSCIGGACELNY